MFNKILITRRNLIASASLSIPLIAIQQAQTALAAARHDNAAPINTFGAVDVRNFGAIGDGIADDAPAINQSIHYLRQSIKVVSGFPLAPKLVFPNGIYLVRSSIDLTHVYAINMLIEGDGSTIHGLCKGKPVIDALGARWLTIRDLTVIGDRVATPRIGLQIGRTSDAVADNHRLDDVKIIGRYSLTSLLNVAAETCGFDHVFLWNDMPDPNSYCLIQDGLNHFGASSDFVSTRQTRDRSDSFNENEFINCDFRHGIGTPIWLGDTARHRFYRCYAAGIGDTAIIVYSGRNGHLMLDIDCHCETTALKNIFLFDGLFQAPVAIRGFSYSDHAPQASQFVFSRTSSVKHVTLQDARIEISFFTVPSCRVLDEPAAWTISGTYYSSTREQWNAGSSFTGTALIGDGVYSSPR